MIRIIVIYLETWTVVRLCANVILLVKLLQFFVVSCEHLSKVMLRLVGFILFLSSTYGTHPTSYAIGIWSFFAKIVFFWGGSVLQCYLLLSGSGSENREYGRRDPSRWLRGTLYPQKLELTLPATGGRSVPPPPQTYGPGITMVDEKFLAVSFPLHDVYLYTNKYVICVIKCWYCFRGILAVDESSLAFHLKFMWSVDHKFRKPWRRLCRGESWMAHAEEDEVDVGTYRPGPERYLQSSVDLRRHPLPYVCMGLSTGTLAHLMCSAVLSYQHFCTLLVPRPAPKLEHHNLVGCLRLNTWRPSRRWII
jgi:hypothetical protein